MCGRFYVPSGAIDKAVAGLAPDLQQAIRDAIKEWTSDLNQPKPMWDIRPTHQYPVITHREVMPMRWGFKTDKSNAVFNAKRESMHFSLWRECLVLRRALVLVGGFYEWTGPKGSKQAHAIERADDSPLLLAAIYNHDPELGHCFSIITTPATQWMLPLHTRMPLILDPAQAGKWLNLSQPPKEVKGLMQPYEGTLREYACPSPRNDVPPRPARDKLF
ncbi:MAG: SOS response-associated peptidase [Planctomycetes bacterium]|nr:SOS response-associated peptidase [Planctomycetota bacterium]MCW8136413.1 SOS response-associated peptidase [Planctomycetota bacterium]